MMQQLRTSSTSSVSSDEILGSYSDFLNEYEYKNEPIDNSKDGDSLELLSWRDIYSACSKNSSPPLPQASNSDCNILEGYQIGNTNLFTQPIQETEVCEILKQHCFSDLDNLDILKNYRCGFTKIKATKGDDSWDEKDDGAEKLAADKIMKMSAERYLECTIQGIDHNHMYIHPYGSSFSHLSTEDLRDVDLGHVLLAAAEKVGYQKYDQASTLLARCERLASDSGTSVQRMVYYFVQALRDRIGRETGRIRTKRIEEKETHGLPPMGLSTNLVFLKFHQEIPFNQVTEFTGTQAILERVEKVNKIHLIDFQIRSGIQWTTFIQALAERKSHPVRRLKITAIALMDRQKVKKTGKRLENFAKSLNLPFSFSVIFLSDIKDLRKEHFQILACEAAVVYCPLILRTMISRPNCLENIMRVIKQLSPSMMVVTEVEANLNSPSFFNRFIEALFFYSAYFDCLEDTTDRDNHYRSVLERVFFGDGIHNIVAAEGEERFTRSMITNAWKTFFHKFKMQPLEISDSSLYQAKMLMDRFPCASSCNLKKTANCLTVGWKNTPIQTVSIWK